MWKTLIRCLCAATAACLLLACQGAETQTLPLRRVTLMYSAAFSNLSASIAEDEKELREGYIPSAGSNEVFLIYSHHTTRAGYYTPTNPVLERVYRGSDGKPRRDTITVYPSTDVSSTPEVLHKVLTEVKEKFPAPAYGLIFSSHARGWLPIDYKEENPFLFSAGAPRKEYPLTKWLGIENAEGSGIDIRDLADAIPMKLDYFVMDACLMGCVEVAYELRDKCRLLVVSPTEILSNGLIYSKMGLRLFHTDSPDLYQVSKDYYDYYMAQSGYYKSATITLVDCTRMEPLVKVCSDIISAHRSGIDAISRYAVQAYFYNELHWFYDLRDIFFNAGATQAEMDRLDAALAECILYKAATPTFFDLELENVCGLSMYLPYPDRKELNSYYKTLSWNKATGLIQ